MITSADEEGLASFTLNPVINRFGIYICGYKNNEPNKYYDFKWVTINYKTEPVPDFNFCSIAIYLGTRYAYTTPDTSYESESEKTGFGTWQKYPGNFYGNTFKANYSKSYDSPTNPLDITGTIHIIFNSDYSVITSITWNESHVVQASNNSIDFTGTNIPLDTYEWGTVYQVKTEEVCNHISSFTHVQIAQDGLSWTMPEYWCNGDSKVYISFLKE